MRLILSALIFAAVFMPALAQGQLPAGLLEKIYAGDAVGVRSEIETLLITEPKNPQITFLDAILTEDAAKAVYKLKAFLSVYPHHTLADDALYRVYSYYYAIGSYKTADEQMEKMRREYPGSPFLAPSVNDLVLPLPEKSKEVAAEDEEPAPAAEDGNYFTVQVGAFLDIKNVAELRGKLREDGYETYVRRKKVGGAEFHIVSAGKLRTSEEAEAVKEELRMKHGLNGLIVPLVQ